MTYLGYMMSGTYFYFYTFSNPYNKIMVVKNDKMNTYNNGQNADSEDCIIILNLWLMEEGRLQ